MTCSSLPTGTISRFRAWQACGRDKRATNGTASHRSRSRSGTTIGWSSQIKGATRSSTPYRRVRSFTTYMAVEFGSPPKCLLICRQWPLALADLGKSSMRRAAISLTTITTSGPGSSLKRRLACRTCSGILLAPPRLFSTDSVGPSDTVIAANCTSCSACRRRSSSPVPAPHRPPAGLRRRWTPVSARRSACGGCRPRSLRCGPLR